MNKNRLNLNKTKNEKINNNNKTKKLLCLPEGDYEDSSIFSSYTLSSDYFKKVEPAGEAFENYIDKKLNPDLDFNENIDEFEDDIDLENEDNIEYEWEKEYRESKEYSSGFSMEKTNNNLKKNKDKSNSEKESENYYSILGLEKEFINATPEEIRKNYKKLALQHHPDKKEINTEKEKEEANKIWVRFQDAYETLTDPDKKQKYDSSFKFNEEIPDEDVSDKIENFYKKLKYNDIISNIDTSYKIFENVDFDKINENSNKTNNNNNNNNNLVKNDELFNKINKINKKFFIEFGPVFLRNSIWSNRKPVPKIGDMNSDIKKVRKFYNFWYNFSSWRDFEVEGEHNLEEAENRWEKRAMLKENKKLKASKIKEEKLRIKNLVDMAYRSDPRLLIVTKKDEEEKERIKQEKQKEREKIKKEKEEKEALLLALAEEKKEKLKEIKKTVFYLIKRILFGEKSSSFKDCFKILDINIEKDKLYHIELNSSFDNNVCFFKELLVILNKEFKDEFKFMFEEYELINIINTNSLIQLNNPDTYNIIINDKDINLIKDNINKEFDSFYNNIILNIHNICNDKAIIADNYRVLCTKYFNTKFSDNDINESTIWTKDELSILQKGIKKYPAGTTRRYEKITDLVKTKSLNQIIQMTRYIATCPNLKILGDSIDLNVLLGKTKKESKDNVKTTSNKELNNNSIITDNGWKDEDQKNLEKALKKYPASIPANERWSSIASEVPGKTKKECVERYKYLAAMIKKK